MKKTNKIINLFLVILITSLVSCDHSEDGLFAEIKTNKGTMLLRLFYDQTPHTVANFASLAEGTNPFVADSLKNKPFYDGVIFHRVIKDFMIQGGDITGTGRGNPGYRFADEIVDSLTHNKKGILSMANAGPGTNGSQFFITLKETPHLNGRHTIFGELVSGEVVLDTIGNVKTANGDRPVEDVVIESVTIHKKGKDAKNFDAATIFKNYKEEEKKEEEEKINNLQKLAEEFTTEAISQQKQAIKYPSGILIYTIEKGSGEKPTPDSQVGVNYAGYLTNGILFDSNIADVAKKHYVFNNQRAAQNGYAPMKIKYTKDMQMIEGFKEALLNMSYGQKVRVFIPSKQGYGERGAGPIPPNSDLIFDVELIK